MDVYLASANVTEIKRAHSLPIAGVLTNPTILRKENLPLRTLVRQVDQIGSLPFGLQIAATREDAMMQEALLFRSMVLNRVLHLKIPFCVDAFRIVPKLPLNGMELNITGVSTLPQAIVALQAPVDFLSIYVGRVTSAGGDGVALLCEVKKYAQMHAKATKIVAASIQNLDHLKEVAMAGADAVALPYSLLFEAIESEVTLASIEGFQKDWATIDLETDK